MYVTRREKSWEINDVRRRVQQKKLGHRGDAGDPLYEVRRLLRRRSDRLSERNITKLEAALHAGDSNDEVPVRLSFSISRHWSYSWRRRSRTCWLG
jgi:hypothetical protein